jgi:hypothetical protein
MRRLMELFRKDHSMDQIDRMPQRDQLRHDLGVLTSDVRGLPLVEVILALLHRAEELTVIADERGEDLSTIRAFLGGET